MMKNNHFYIKLYFILTFIIVGVYGLIKLHNNDEIEHFEYEHLLEDKKAFPKFSKHFTEISKDGKVTNKEFNLIHDIINEHNKKLYAEKIIKPLQNEDEYE